MVSRTTGYKIIPALIIGICIIVTPFFFVKEKRSDLLYIATASDLDFAVVDGIVKVNKNSKYTTNETIKAVIVPHHLVATEAIAAGIKSLATKKRRIVLVISPDHFGGCPKLICTTNGVYKTFFGDISIDSKIVKQLIGHKNIVDVSNLFINEHGIYSIVPYIKHYLPEATIVPIVISQKGRGTYESRKDMLAMLDTLVTRNDVLLVVSSDFSHYLPIEEADIYDKETQASFCSGNSNEILTLKNPSQSDCPLCLWVLQEEAKKNNFWKPQIIWHSNSANLLHDVSVKETTSHFTFTFNTRSSSLNQNNMQTNCYTDI